MASGFRDLATPGVSLGEAGGLALERGGEAATVDGGGERHVGDHRGLPGFPAARTVRWTGCRPLARSGDQWGRLAYPQTGHVATPVAGSIARNVAQPFVRQ